MTLMEAAVSGIAYVIMALFIGTLAIASFVLPKDETVLRRTLLSSAPILLLAFLLVALLSLFIQGMKLRGGSMPTLDIFSRYLLRTQSGRIWLGRELYAVFLVLLATIGFKRSTKVARIARWLFFLSLPLVAGRSLMSHAVAVKENTALVVTADAVHAVVTGLWAGGLAALVWTLHRGMGRLALPISWAGETVGRFSRLALLSVPFLVLTGLYQGVIQVQTVNALFRSAYGRILLLKFFLFLTMMALGAVNFLSTKPKLLQGALGDGEPDLLRKKAFRRIGMESLLGLVVLCVTGFLTTLPPGAHSLHANPAGGNRIEAAGRITTALTKLWAAVVSSQSELQPAEGAKVTILSPKSDEALKGDEIPMRYEFIKGKRGNHLHAYIDGVLMGMFSDPERGVLTGIQPGRHTLELRVVAQDHVTELDATASVRFLVR